MDIGMNLPDLWEVYLMQHLKQIHILNELSWRELHEYQKNHDAELLELGVSKEHIRHYGFAFEGKI